MNFLRARLPRAPVVCVTLTLLALGLWHLDVWASVNSVTIHSVTPTAVWLKRTDLPSLVSVTYSWSGTNITGAALSIGAPPPPLGAPMAVQNISFTVDSGTRTDKVPVPTGLPDGKHTLYIAIFSSTAPVNLSAQISQAIWIDKSPPTIFYRRSPEPNAAGWNNSDVLISFECTDGAEGAQTSGVASCPMPVLVTGEGADQSVVVVSTDLAGNKYVLTIDNINIDKTPPRLRINRPAAGAVYAIGQKINADWSVQDDWSGVASILASAAKGTPFDTSSLGTKTFTLTATDAAGNTASLPVTYEISYDFTFLSPLRANKVNTFALGKAMPIKFRLLDGRRSPIRGVAATLWYRAADAKGQPLDENYLPAPPRAPFDSDSFFYYAYGAYYYFSVDSTAVGAGRWQFEVRLEDGTRRTFDVLIRGTSQPRKTSSADAARPESALSMPLNHDAWDSLTVEFFDIRGRLLQRDEQKNPGRSAVEASLARLYTERRLANGAYLYRVSARGSRGELLASQVRKFYVLR